MEHLAMISNKSFRAIGFHKIRSPSSPYSPAPQGSQLITLDDDGDDSCDDSGDNSGDDDGDTSGDNYGEDSCDDSGDDSSDDDGDKGGIKDYTCHEAYNYLQ